MPAPAVPAARASRSPETMPSVTELRTAHTADLDGAIYVLPVSVPVDLAGDLTCDYRPAALW